MLNRALLKRQFCRSVENDTPHLGNMSKQVVGRALRMWPFASEVHPGGLHSETQRSDDVGIGVVAYEQRCRRVTADK